MLADRHIDLMITDINMPGLSGWELARQAKLFRPRLHIIYISGYCKPAEDSDPEYGRLLQKPVRPAALLETVQTELARV